MLFPDAFVEFEVVVGFSWDAYLRVTSIPVISDQGTGYLHRIPWANPYLRHEINDLEKGLLSRPVQHTRCSLPVTSSGEVVIVSCIPMTKTGCFCRFFKLDMIALEWSSLPDQELDHINCFLYKGQSIQAKEEGKMKVVVAGRSRRAETTECLTSCWPVHTL
ncbi:hypothetical protein ACQJBY_070060 [Aegilops geniculata]